MEVKVGTCLCSTPGRKPEQVITKEDGESCEPYLLRCPLYMRLKGKNPLEGEPDIDTWNCALAFQPILTIEGAAFTRQVKNEVEALRKEIVQGQESLYSFLAEAKTERLAQAASACDTPKIINSEKE